ncbi:MAG: type II toxin-antitoxin system RelE/ParE family toxin [Flavobacterium sp.]|nr:type II toxin-antitoxin system RelE/ParE family toxin [Flavobacterium sp.]
MALKIVWSIDAQVSRRSIFEYWNKRNKSRVYSNKLNILFNESINQVSLLHETGKPTEFKNIRLKFVSHFEVIYHVSDTKITILDIWDTRQNPQDFPIQ